MSTTMEMTTQMNSELPNSKTSIFFICFENPTRTVGIYTLNISEGGIINCNTDRWTDEPENPELA